MLTCEISVAVAPEYSGQLLRTFTVGAAPTPLYARLQKEGRLLMEPWWLHESYRYGMVPFQPRGLSPERLADLCIEARKRFYGWPSIGKRLGHWVNLRDPLMAAYFVVINAMHQIDVGGRHGLPLGDAGHRVELLEAA